MSLSQGQIWSLYLLAYVGLSCGQCGPILLLCWPMFGSWWPMLNRKNREMGTRTQDILMVGALSWSYVGPSWGCVGLSWGNMGPSWDVEINKILVKLVYEAMLPNTLCPYAAVSCWVFSSQPSSSLCILGFKNLLSRDLSWLKCVPFEQSVSRLLRVSFSRWTTPVPCVSHPPQLYMSHMRKVDNKFIIIHILMMHVYAYTSLENYDGKHKPLGIANATWWEIPYINTSYYMGKYLIIH